jgi:hypothetical protein
MSPHQARLLGIQAARLHGGAVHLIVQTGEIGAQ